MIKTYLGNCIEVMKTNNKGDITMSEQRNKTLKQAEELNDRAFNARMNGTINDHEFMTLMKIVSSMIDEVERIKEIEDYE